MSENKQSNPKTIVGEVISNKADKTIVVKWVRLVKHPKYGKYVKRPTKLLVHDPSNRCVVGDIVAIQQIPPKSKRKAWGLVEVIESKQA